MPKFTLKHATNVEFDELVPQAIREKKGDTILNSHTGGGDERRHVSYFVLGLGDNHKTPNFLGNQTDTITLQIGKVSLQSAKGDLNAQKINDLFRGFLVGGHYTEYLRSEKMPPVVFGDTVRHISFDKETMTKTYHYFYADGSKKERTVYFKDEIFVADKNLNSVFDALFFQFILELRNIGGSLQKYFYKNPDNVEDIIATFHILFPSWVYPEVQIPQAIPLKETKDLNITPYLQVQFKAESSILLQRKWFNYAKNNNVNQLESCLQKAEKLSFSLLDSINSDDHASALIVATKYSGNSEAIDFLLERGADITIKSQDGRDVLDCAIEIGDLELIKRLLKGIKNPKMNLIIHQPLIDIPKLLEKSLENDKVDIFKYFLKVFSIPSDCPIWLISYKHLKEKNRKEVFSLLQEAKSDVNTANKEGLTILMCAAENGDLELVKELIELKADVNHIILEGKNQGRTALHLAALAGQIEVVNYLITVANADVKIMDAQGDSFYSSVMTEIEQFKVTLHSEPTVSESSYEHYKYNERKNQFEKLKLMKINLEEIGVDTHPPVKTIAQRARRRSYNCVALVVGTVKGNPAVVLGRKRDHTTLQPDGFYLLPGGGVDSSREPAEDAVLRELKEETGISVDKNIAKHFYTYENLYEVGDSKTYVQTKFYIIDLGEKLAELKPKPGSDLAEVKILKWKDITKEMHPVSKKISPQGYLVNYLENNGTTLRSSLPRNLMI